MPIPNPDHLFDQAKRLTTAPTAGPPRQVDLRRAISAAYYAVFHSTLTAMADQFVGATKRATARYGLVYRSIDHRWLRQLCEELVKPTPPRRYLSHIPADGIGPSIQAFAAAVIDLQEKRHAADYDPMIRVRTSDALLAIRAAEAAVSRFRSAAAAQREAFLSLLAFPPRRP